ncbi:GreA/GreB family elongation factor [Paenibacillus qinlingensis]|uniref:GreA/GreB family elongation factor n=1 Tax=Paenibacillus qinlingensis TaxID=1837343 RepID=UPI001564886B|nr:GreA/GreB family elongation factor [Paenibacillus qinlingensis]NQX64182.1 GreA/GreB family elongation factor [Paenibacillus qinlingensis]
MNRSHMSNPTRSRLVDQLVFLDEQITMYLDSYPSQQKIQIKQYVKLLERLLELDDVNLVQTLSKVTVIGSNITICYEEEGSNELFTVVLPTEIDPDQNRISLFSPIGNQLLSRSTGETFILQTPEAEYSVRIVGTALS